MAKGYWVSCYHSIKDPEKLAAYAKLAAPSIQRSGGRFVVRGPAAKAYEQGYLQRTVIVEFESLDAAIAARESPGYQEALRALGDGVVRDFRICEGA
jgi:uncharacterized protein (DUF1330 family)